MNGQVLSADWLITLIDRERSSTAETLGHMECPLCSNGTLYYYYEINGPRGNVLHASCNHDSCLPLSALQQEAKKNGKVQ
jgi:hypothetical protein